MLADSLTLLKTFSSPSSLSIRAYFLLGAPFPRFQRRHHYLIIHGLSQQTEPPCPTIYLQPSSMFCRVQELMDVLFATCTITVTVNAKLCRTTHEQVRPDNHTPSAYIKKPSESHNMEVVSTGQAEHWPSRGRLILRQGSPFFQLFPLKKNKTWASILPELRPSNPKTVPSITVLTVQCTVFYSNNTD